MEPGRQSRLRRTAPSDGTSTAASKPDMPLPVVAVASTAELVTELERVSSVLVPAVDWTQRVDALLRLEGLARGGAAEFEAFPELLLGLHDALAAQMQERRSAVSRQACHTVAKLAGVCGADFEPLAVHLLPVVFKSLAMGIQVVSEAANACAHAMLAACPSARLLSLLCTVVASDRNGRLRQSAAELLLQALQGWELAAFERQMEGVERAVIAAVQDAQVETRAVGRSMFGAYAYARPAAAQAMLARLERDRQLQDKLMAAAREYLPVFESFGPPLKHTCGPSGHQQPSVAVRLAPAMPKLALAGLNGSADSKQGSPSQPSAACATAGHCTTSQGMRQQYPVAARENQPDNPAGAVVQATPRSMFPKREHGALVRREATAAADPDEDAQPARQAAVGRDRLVPRRSVGGAALRMSVASFRRQQDLGEAAAEPALQQRTLGPQRGFVRAPLPAQFAQVEHAQPAGLQAAPQAAARWVSGQERQTSSVPEGAESVRMGSSVVEASISSVAPLLARLGSAEWAERVSMFQAIQCAMEQSAGSLAVAADVGSNADRLLAALLDGSGDAHFRVAAAALAALGAGLASPCSRMFEPQLDRVMTVLFARVADPKEQIRTLVGAALAAALVQHSADAVVAALARSLQANRAPRVKCAIMDFFAEAARGCGDVDHTSLEQTGLLLRLTGSGSELGGLLRSLLQLTTDKNPDIRRAASDAVAAAYHGGQSQTVLAVVSSLPPADLLSVQRVLAVSIQQRGSGDDVASGPPSMPRSKDAGLPVSSQNWDGTEQDVAQQPACPQSTDQSSPWSSESGRSPRIAVHQLAPAPPAVQHYTPEPPSPFMWRVLSASPVRACERVAAKPADPSLAAKHTEVAAAAAANCDVQPDVHAATASASKQTAGLELAQSDEAMAVHLPKLVQQVVAEPSSETFRGLSCLARVLPPAAWLPCFQEVIGAIGEALDSSCMMLRDAALVLARDLAAVMQQPSLFLPSLPALLPRLLACAAEREMREVAFAGHEALDALLRRAPPQRCFDVLVQRLAGQAEPASTDWQRGAELHAIVRSLQRVVGLMQPADLSRHLQPLLLPGLCSAFGSPLTDVRKAAVDCLLGIWLVVGDAIRPHLDRLSASQLRLLHIYFDRAGRHVR